MIEYEIVDKISAARRQLISAIYMFFERKDSIAIYSLSWDAYQILTDLCKQKGIQREIEDSEILNEISKLSEVITAMRKPRNFFKHSDRESDDATIKFFPDASYLILASSCQYFLKLTGDLFYEGRLFQWWFLLKHPDRAPQDWEIKLGEASKIISFNDYELFLEVLLKNK